MKEYRVLTAKNTEDAEAMMNDMARQGWTVKAVVPWQTLYGPRLAITFEKNA